MTDAKSLVGFHFILYRGPADGSGSRATGEVAALVSHGAGDAPATYLLRFDDYDGVQPPLELASVSEMLEECEPGMKQYNFFRTRAELDAWQKWLDLPPPEGGKRVLSLIRTGKGKEE